MFPEQKKYVLGLPESMNYLLPMLGLQNPKVEKGKEQMCL